MADFNPKFRIVSIADVPVTAELMTKLPEGTAYQEALADMSCPGLAFPSDIDIPDGSIALHPIFGIVTWASRWYFSTEKFIANLKAAEENPAIIAHLIRIDSPGGEAFGCHEAFVAVKQLKKPCIAIIDSICASGAYWIACAADKIYASSMFSEIGSIGAMGIIRSERKWMEKQGFEEIVCYSKHSDLKNKFGRDVLDGHPEEYISRMLDPLAEQFIADVRSTRKIQDGSEALRGQIFYAANAQSENLIDGEMSVCDAISIIISKAEADKDININNLNIILE